MRSTSKHFIINYIAFLDFPIIRCSTRWQMQDYWLKFQRFGMQSVHKYKSKNCAYSATSDGHWEYSGPLRCRTLQTPPNRLHHAICEMYTLLAISNSHLCSASRSESRKPRWNQQHFASLANVLLIELHFTCNIQSSLRSCEILRFVSIDKGESRRLVCIKGIKEVYRNQDDISYFMSKHLTYCLLP